MYWTLLSLEICGEQSWYGPYLPGADVLEGDKLGKAVQETRGCDWGERMAIKEAFLMRVH